MRVLMIEHYGGGDSLYSYCLCEKLALLDLNLTVISTDSALEPSSLYKVLRFYPSYAPLAMLPKIFRYLVANIKTYYLILKESI